MKKLLLCMFVVACGSGTEKEIVEICSVQQAVYSGEITSDYLTTAEVYSEVGSCSGTLIHTRTILTAAHCLRDSGPATVVLDGQFYDEVDRIIHPFWIYNPDRASRNDLALIILDRDVPITPAILDPNSVKRGDRVAIVGFGITDVNLNDFGIKRIGHAEVLAIGEYSYTVGGDSSICSGDSGGSVYKYGYLVGVHWAGPKENCHEGYETPIAPFYDWIVQNAVGSCGGL